MPNALSQATYFTLTFQFNRVNLGHACWCIWNKNFQSHKILVWQCLKSVTSIDMEHAAFWNMRLKEMAVCILTELLEWLRMRISFYPILVILSLCTFKGNRFWFISDWKRSSWHVTDLILQQRIQCEILCAGSRPDEVLPPLERMLEAQQLGNLKDNSSFQYLLKMGYENVHRTLNTYP
jgi:hypothetical protein